MLQTSISLLLLLLFSVLADDFLRYFNKAEMKDAMEEKMLSTTSLAIKAVTCHICNYTSFKASELCRWIYCSYF